MKIEHVAIWANDIDKVCEFYRKYFGGVVQPLYHNPAKQFTSRFVTFESGARLEVMHRPDINVGTLTESKPDLACVSRETLANRGCDEKFIFRHIRGAASWLRRSPTQPRFPSKNELAHFYLETEGCRPMAKPEAQQSEIAEHLGFAHLSFSVGSKEDVDRLTQKMSDDGISIVGEPRTTGDGYYESVVLDPEGNRIEITV